MKLTIWHLVWLAMWLMVFLTACLELTGIEQMIVCPALLIGVAFAILGWHDKKEPDIYDVSDMD